jgi:pimeloyl-ACP methyl ester carboxylesterase
MLCGWSYGPLVILDYLRHYGEEGVGGIHFVGGITKLGSDEALSVLTPEFLGLVPSLMSMDAEESLRALDRLLQLCIAEELSPADHDLMLGYSASVPPYVRQALLARSFDNEDLLPRIRKPVLLTQGANERVVRRAAIDQHKASMPHAQVHLMPDVGHAPFWDDAKHFNARLQAFAEGAWHGDAAGIP